MKKRQPLQAEEIWAATWQAIEKFGRTKLALALGVTELAVLSWNRRHGIPSKHWMRVEQIVGIDRHRQAPSVFIGYERKS